MKHTRFLSGALACLLALSGCGVTPTQPLSSEPSPQGAVIAYVPLDDRPDNVERVVYLAQSMGYTLSMPESDTYRTRLAYQPTNANGTQYGDRAALYEWVLAQEEAGCDRYILSLDQLLSGGLVNSRAMEEMEPVTLSDGRELYETELLDGLWQALTSDENNTVYLLESVMRLAPTVGYGHWTIEEYNALRSYGAQPRAALAEQSLEAVYQTYTRSPDGTALSPQDYDLAPWEVELYLAARQRKMALSDRLLRLRQTPPAAAVHVLIGIDDSSVAESIQKAEIAYLRSLLQEGDALLSGVDDLAFKAAARLYLDEIGWQGAAVSIRYFGGTENAPACAYDSQPFEEIVAEHLAYFGLWESDSPELEIVALTQPADSARKDAYCKAAVERVRENRKAGLPTILIDAGNGQYGAAFQQLLTKEAELGWLLSYAGFLDMAIVTGTAVSHGVARYAFLRSGTDTPATQRAFARTLADSILKDFCYKHQVRDSLLGYIRGELAGNPDNFYQPPLDRAALVSRLQEEMDRSAADVVRNLERSNFIVSLAPQYAEQGWGGIALTDYSFPWERAFEIHMEIGLGEPTPPHKTLFGIPYA